MLLFFREWEVWTCRRVVGHSSREGSGIDECIDYCSTEDDVVVLETSIDEYIDCCSTGDDVVVLKIRLGVSSLRTGLGGVGCSSRKESGIDECIDCWDNTGNLGGAGDDVVVLKIRLGVSSLKTGGSNDTLAALALNMRIFRDSVRECSAWW